MFKKKGVLLYQWQHKKSITICLFKKTQIKHKLYLREKIKNNKLVFRTILTSLIDHDHAIFYEKPPSESSQNVPAVASLPSGRKIFVHLKPLKDEN